MQDDPRPDYTKLGPVGEQKLQLNQELSAALPTATREEIAQVQAPLQTAPADVVTATVEELRATPDDTALERVQAGEPASLLVEPETARREHG